MQKDYSFVKDATDDAIEFQLNYTFDCIKNDRTYPGLSMIETVEFHDALKAEDSLRWENGNKQKFQEMLIRTFGKSAITV
jgi:hypothetical protein